MRTYAPERLPARRDVQPGEPPFSRGDTCDRYRIDSVIGAGAMGVVYEAHHTALKQQVALKVLHAAGGDYSERLVAEAQALALIKHRYVVRVLNGGAEPDGTPWFAMERLKGDTLREVLDGRQHAFATVVRYGSQVAEAAAAVHGMGIVHRDLKPENIFVIQPEDEVRILDFGLAKWRNRGIKSTDRMRLIGTTAYMPQEYITGLVVDPRWDVYSLGHVLYEMLAGRHCFSDGSGPFSFGSRQLTEMQVHEQPPPIRKWRPNTPGGLAELVDQCLEKPIKARPTMAQVAERLKSVAATLQAEARSGVKAREPTWAVSLGLSEYPEAPTVGAQIVLGAARFGCVRDRGAVESMFAAVLTREGTAGAELIENTCIAAALGSYADKELLYRLIRGWAFGAEAAAGEVRKRIEKIVGEAWTARPEYFRADHWRYSRVAFGAASLLPQVDRDHAAISALYEFPFHSAEYNKLAHSALLLMTRLWCQDRASVRDALKMLGSTDPSWREAGRTRLGALLHASHRASEVVR